MNDREFDAEADALGSYYDAIAAIGALVKAGAPVPTTGYFAVTSDFPASNEAEKQEVR